MLNVASIVTRVADVVATVARWVIGLCLFALLAAVATQIFGRHVLHSTPSWTEVFASLMMTWLSFIGAAYAVRLDENMAIAVIPEALSGWARTILLVIIGIVGMIFGYLLLDASIEQLSLLGSSTIIGLGISTQWLYLSAPIAAGLMLLFLAERMLLALVTRDGPATKNEVSL
ncbi:TRAP transporter small permease [Aerobium aerolatum]|uniref:TRAP transporter small permease protein n=1 Tax=Aquamicrobium aerolatum DSM 21857 TaxID=1121003 RepID=A0A1I3SIY5_9HYPH|nr:TRAP transporter small permease [Aquamicrobium aerolatum]SFJ58655.1 TRAP-type C4-dicarboxylate transport system, small permease component [Aquamicrobium aerolatum DSM 21857]